MIGHTPAPWTIQPYVDGDEGIWIIGSRVNPDGTILAMPTNGAVAFVSMHPTEIDAGDTTRALANAKRIVNCVNEMAALENLSHDSRVSSEGIGMRVRSLAAATS